MVVFGKSMNSRKILLLILVVATLIRLWRISDLPVSLFGDELDVGYHAYSILKTGRDYSGNFLPLHFQSLAEWRTPLYLYSAVPTVALFGISPLGVRLPAVIFGILGIWLFYLLVKLIIKKESVALLAALLLAISPWHIQYSRAGFEVTQMLALYLAGVYLFLRGIKEGRWLVPSAVFLALTPWVYSTAKFFLPLTLVALILIWRRELLAVPRKYLVYAGVAFFVVVTPITWSTIFGGGTARFAYVSVFTDPTTVPEVGFARLRDAQMRDPDVGIGVQPQLSDRIIHNKFTWWAAVLSRNYLQSFSTQFLFIKGDLNLRHSPDGIGQFYKIEVLFLLLGVVFLLTQRLDKKLKLFIVFWLLAAPIPAALTRDGGMHATRLFFFLPPLVFLTSLGIYYSWVAFKKKWQGLFALGLAGLYLLSFVFYQHTFWVHYPWDSERWWHAGFEEAIQSIKEVEKDYDRVVISMAGEPAWIFFAGWYEYPPDKWHSEFPIGNDVDLEGFGRVSHTDKFYFGSPEVEGLYSWGEVIDGKTLYLASEKEVRVNLIREPERTPEDLQLIRSIAYPSGEPAFYLFSGK